MGITLKYLKEKEWSIGNGQCPECCGVHKGWLGHPLYLTSKNIGHERNCKLAKPIKELGGNPLFKGDFKSNKKYEEYIDDNGFLGTRLKTKDGCPVLKEYNRKLKAEINDLFYKHLCGST